MMNEKIKAAMGRISPAAEMDKEEKNKPKMGFDIKNMKFRRRQLKMTWDDYSME
jgi:hypothetical protein